MVDYSFLENQDGKKRGRIEFFDVDMPATLPGITNSVEIVRKRMTEGDKKIDEMGAEVKALVLKDEADFGRATEMIGQLKNLKKLLSDAVNKYKDPIYDLYKTMRDILGVRKDKIDAHIEIIQQKQNQLAYQLEMNRREAKRRADEAAAELQKKLDAEQAAIDAKEKEKAKEEKREPVFSAPIKVDAPVIPKEIKTKTESGSAKIEMVLMPKITDIKSPYIFQKVIQHFQFKYKELAIKALEKDIKAGALGLKGAEGVTVEEKAVTKHRRR